MHIQINFGNIPSTDAIYDAALADVQNALQHFADRITRVEVHLNDDNGPKAGVDKRCTMEARIAGQQPLAVEDRADDLYAAIAGAADKLQRAVGNKLGRLESR